MSTTEFPDIIVTESDISIFTMLDFNLWTEEENFSCCQNYCNLFRIDQSSRCSQKSGNCRRIILIMFF